jgi:hypothetical protein
LILFSVIFIVVLPDIKDDLQKLLGDLETKIQEEIKNIEQ